MSEQNPGIDRFCRRRYYQTLRKSAVSIGFVFYGSTWLKPRSRSPSTNLICGGFKYWVPSISPSGITFYNHDRIPNWKGNLFMTTLSGQHLRRLVMKDNQVIQEESLLNNLGLRFRCVRVAPDGRLFLSTDDGQIILITNSPNPKCP